MFVKEIQLFDDKMIIIYYTPISLDESQGFCFYENNVPYPIYIQNKIKPRMIDFQLEMRFDNFTARLFIPRSAWAMSLSGACNKADYATL